MREANGYKHLGPRQGSNYSQFFIKGTRTRAETIYRETVGIDPRIPEQVAEDFALPLEVVQECVRFCEENAPLLRRERDREAASIRALGLDKPPHVPMDYVPDA